MLSLNSEQTGSAIEAFKRRIGAGDADMVVIYDGQCILCSAYVRVARLRAAVGTVKILDARTADIAALTWETFRLNLNDGMLVLYEGKHYYGSDAVNILSLLSSGSGALNRSLAAVFRYPTLSRWFYPLLRGGRSVTLALLGRKEIEVS